MGISTVSLWRRQREWLSDGVAALATSRTGPKGAWKVAPEVAARIVELHGQCHSRARVAELAGVSTYSVWRVRISRELHDLIGHHLTALAVNMDVAGYLTEGRAQRHVQKSHALAKLLLADVRDVVSSMREGAVFDLTGQLEALVRDIPRPAIHLSVPGELGIDDVARAHALLRCVQEIVTNTVRHAGARNLWVEVVRTPEGITERARDDTRGSGGPIRAGDGLSGMRERLEPLGSAPQVSASPRGGFAL